MLIAIGKFGEMLDAPSPYELSETFLKREVDETKKKSQAIQGELYCQ